MAIYDVTGTELYTAYNAAGTALASVFDFEGNEISILLPYSIDNVVSYYKQPTLDMADTIGALSDEWENIVLITDPHGTRNEQHSQAIALYLLSNVPNISKIVLNGDYVIAEWIKSQYTTYMSEFLNSGWMKNIYATIGNHDQNQEELIYEDFLNDKTDIVGSIEDCYYYTDIADKKLRLMFINTSTGGEITVSQDELNWIEQNVVLPDSSWSLAVIGHGNIDSMGGICYMNITNGAVLANAITECNGSIVGYFCGHQHIDDTRNIGDFQQTMLLCDRFENTNYYPGYSFTNRVTGTTSEQAVSVISINTTTKQVVVRRIGAGWPEIVSGLNYSYGS